MNKLPLIRTYSGIVLSACALVLFLAWQPREKVNYQTVKLADIVTVKVPENFLKLNDDQIADKIIAPRKPLAMYSSPSGSADFSVSVGNSSKNPWMDKDLKLMAEFQKANIKQLFTSVTFLQEKIVKIRGQQFAAFEFISEVKEPGKNPIRKYNNLRYTIHKKNMLIFSFICSELERPLYQSVSEEILGSIKF